MDHPCGAHRLVTSSRSLSELILQPQDAQDSVLQTLDISTNLFVAHIKYAESPFPCTVTRRADHRHVERFWHEPQTLCQKEYLLHMQILFCTAYNLRSQSRGPVAE